MNLLMIHLTKGLLQLIIWTHKVSAIVWCYTFDIATLPLSAKINKSVSIEFVISICTNLLARQVNIAPYLFSSFLHYFMINGPNISTPQYVKWGESVTLRLGHSAIFCVPNLPLKLLHMTLLLKTLLVTLFPHIMQKPKLLNWLGVTPLSECPTLMWHHFRIFLEMMASFGSTIVWRRFSLYVDRFSLPPTLIIPSSDNKWIQSVKRALSFNVLIFSIASNGFDFSSNWSPLNHSDNKLFGLLHHLSIYQTIAFRI